MALGLPSWLEINPLDPVKFYTQGFSQGAEARSARNRAQLASMELAQRQADRIADDQARAQAAELSAARFAAELGLKREENERKAALSAKRYEALDGVRRDMQAGVPIEQAFLNHPAALGEDMSALPSVLRAFQMDRERGPMTMQDVMDRIHRIPIPGGGEATIMQTGPHTLSEMDKAARTRNAPGTMTAQERVQWQAANDAVKRWVKKVDELEPRAAVNPEKQKQYSTATNELAKALQLRDAILTNRPPRMIPVPLPEPPPSTGDRNAPRPVAMPEPSLPPGALNMPRPVPMPSSPLPQTAAPPDRNEAALEAAALIRQYPKLEPAIRARFRETFGVDL